MGNHPGGLVRFDIRTPKADLAGQVDNCLARGLPDVPILNARPERLRIIANGPSAQHAPLDGPTLALNGALKTFTDRGRFPTFWAACDPQELVVNFLEVAPPETIYLLASKCHPEVFKRLAGRQVFTWHILEGSTLELIGHKAPVMSGVTITIVALELMTKLGFGRFETWGWDGCFMDGQGHAHEQTLPDDAITLEVGDLSFQTRPSWALEVKNAVDDFLPRYDVRIMGGGLIGALRDFMRGPSFLI